MGGDLTLDLHTSLDFGLRKMRKKIRVHFADPPGATPCTTMDLFFVVVVFWTLSTRTDAT